MCALGGRIGHASCPSQLSMHLLYGTRRSFAQGSATAEMQAAAQVALEWTQARRLGASLRGPAFTRTN